MIHEHRPGRSFKLHLRCTNCLKPAVQTLEVPDVDDAPQDIDELLESALLARFPFSCRCGNVIGQIISVKGPMNS
jgi:hypothetical protein